MRTFSPFFYACLAVALGVSAPAHAQEDLLEQIAETERKPQVFGTFHANVLVNLPTVETAGKGEILLNFVHRFGEMTGPRGGIDALYGLDFVHDIRLAFYYGITDRLHVGVARSKIGRRLDGEVKYKVLQQRIGGMPVSVTALGNVAVGTEENAAVQGPASNVENPVQLYPDFNSRLTYLVALPIAKKFGDRLSVQVVPMWLHRNYLTARLDDHDVFAVGVGTRFAVSNHFALTSEYVQTLSPYRLYQVDNFKYYAPLSLGFEVVAGGHVFQMSLSNTAVLPNEFLVNGNTSWGEGEMRLGFNIVRSIGVSKRRGN